MVRIALLLILIPIVAFIPDSYACYSRSGGTGTLNIDMGNITVPNNSTIPVGGVIQTIMDGKINSYGASLPGFTCGSPGDGALTTSVVVSGDGSSTANATYATNIPGVGLKFYYYSAAAYGSEPTTPTQTYTSFSTYISDAYHQSYGPNGNASLKIELIKTDEVNSGASGALNFSHNGIIQTADGLDLLNLNISGNIAFPSCSLNSITPTSVDLGTVSESLLKDVGSTSNTKNFSVILDCENTPNVDITVSGSESTDAPNNGVLALDASSTADGLGVQLLFNNTPIVFGQEFFAGTASDGKFTIPMQARFYKTKSKLSGGDVSSSMNYTLTYR